jgi:uncharacterized coiled-coil protein SlyX
MIPYSNTIQFQMEKKLSQLEERVEILESQNGSSKKIMTILEVVQKTTFRINRLQHQVVILDGKIKDCENKGYEMQKSGYSYNKEMILDEIEFLEYILNSIQD